MPHHKRRSFRRLSPPESQTLAKVEAAVERAGADASLSKQPRFDDKDPKSFFTGVQNWVLRAELQEEPYMPMSAKRDKWLRSFWRLEPHLAGVLNSIIAIDKNRGWSLTGGRNQVLRYTDVMHTATAAPGLTGWRNFFSTQALSYYATDMCTVAELGTDGPNGPLRALYHTDSARCQLTGRSDFPLRYNSGAIGSIASGTPWAAGDFFRVVSMPSDDETFNGLGFCAVSRCLELAKLMVAVYRHDAEALGARMPDGLLLLQNISQDQWEAAMAVREANMNAKERKYFGGVFVLAQAGIDQVDAKLVALSNLPQGFDLEIFTDQLMFGYALCCGYSPREFWPVSSGALGSATESETQDDNSTGKGESDFILNYQEQLQEELPESILVEFDRRDAKGDIETLAIAQAKASLVGAQAGWMVGGVPVLTPEQVLQLAADQELIPPEWTQAEEDITSTDTDDKARARLREQYREHPAVVRAIEHFPAEPIVRYEYPSRRMITLWDSGREAKRKRVWTGESMNSRHITRLADAIEIAAKAMVAQPAQPAQVVIPAPAAAPAPATSPITIISNDSQMESLARALRQEPPVVNVTIDTNALANAFRALPAAASAEDISNSMMRTMIAMIDKLPRGPAPEVFAESVTRALVTAFEKFPRGPSMAEIAQIFGKALVELPRGPDAETIARALRDGQPPAPKPFDYEALGNVLSTALAQMPHGPDMDMLAAAVARAMPSGPEPFDYQKFSVALTDALKNMPAIVVNVPEQAAPNITLEMPTRESAKFDVRYDSGGQITQITKESKAS